MRGRRSRSASVYPEGWGPVLERLDSHPENRGAFLRSWTAIVAVSVALGCGAAWAFAQTEQPTPAEKRSATMITLPPSPKALLPDAFDGWVTAEPSEVLANAALADPANAAALKEYGFAIGLVAHYKREGDTLVLRALSFNDASGAYGAYTYYRQNDWPKESIGMGAASYHNRVLFWTGTTVVDATLSRIGPMSGGEMREIARQLPSPPETARWRRLFWPACLRLARRPDHPLRGGAGGLRGSRGRAAAVARRLRQGRRSRHRQLLAGFKPGYAHHHRLPHAADRPGAGSRDSRLPEGRRPRPSRPGPSR